MCAKGEPEKKAGGFFERVYDVVRKIPKGKVATYGQIAAILGQPRKAKFVGWALHKNPYFGEVPCHRVVNRHGELSGAFAFGGADVQRRLLASEGVEFDDEGRVVLDRYLWVISCGVDSCSHNVIDC